MVMIIMICTGYGDNKKSLQLCYTVTACRYSHNSSGTNFCFRHHYSHAAVFSYPF